MPDYRIIMLLKSKDNNKKCQKIDELTQVCIAAFFFQFSVNILMIYCWDIAGVRALLQ